MRDEVLQTPLPTGSPARVNEVSRPHVFCTFL